VSTVVPVQQRPTPDGCPAPAAAYAAAVAIDPAIEWQMEPSEQNTVISLVSGLRPRVAIEIGSRYGGSMQVLSRYADRVISVDIDPTCKDRLGPKYPNAVFVTGDSRLTFAPLMKQLEREGAEVGFILIDGDHSAAGVKSDIGGLLSYRPRCPLFVLMHDSFNPDVRKGIRTAPWGESEYVHSVEIDYLAGVLTMGRDDYREMWGGLALAVLLPEPRSGPLVLSSRREAFFRLVYRRSAHWPYDPPTLAKRVVRKAKRMVGLK
jgi:hypothetical protein